MYMDVAFGSVRMVVRFLEMTLSGYKEGDFMEPDLTAERVAYFLAQQCEVSLQFLQSVCQQKLFKERLLKNKVFPTRSFFYSFGEACSTSLKREFLLPFITVVYL